jgi:hypothetical protein
MKTEIPPKIARRDFFLPNEFLETWMACFASAIQPDRLWCFEPRDPPSPEENLL